MKNKRVLKKNILRYNIFMKIFSIDRFIKYMGIPDINNPVKTVKEVCRELKINRVTLNKKLNELGLEIIQFVSIIKKRS
jgi:hypothetical protein